MSNSSGLHQDQNIDIVVTTVRRKERKMEGGIWVFTTLSRRRLQIKTASELKDHREIWPPIMAKRCTSRERSREHFILGKIAVEGFYLFKKYIDPLRADFISASGEKSKLLTSPWLIQHDDLQSLLFLWGNSCSCSLETIPPKCQFSTQTEPKSVGY